MVISKEYLSAPWRWCEIDWNMQEKYGTDMYWMHSIHVVGVIEETSNVWKCMEWKISKTSVCSIDVKEE